MNKFSGYPEPTALEAAQAATLVRLSCEDYYLAGKDGVIDMPLAKMIEIFGQPWRNPRSFHPEEIADDQGEYPDDETKTDVCWSFETGRGAISIWNYKNGPAYRETATLEGVGRFSVGWENAEAAAIFWQILKKEKISNVRPSLSIRQRPHPQGDGACTSKSF